MLFNSLQYLVFLPLVVIATYSIPQRARWLLLLVASYYFYMCWKPEYAVLIAASTLIDYCAGRAMGAQPERRGRRPYLVLSLVSNLGLLFAFKYWNFFSASARSLLERFDVFTDLPFFDVLLPVGISFYTFQTLSYTIDVYRGRQQPERHLGIFALYVAFFPQLVAGPIERSTQLLPQFRKRVHFDAERVASGLRLILWGLFQKLVIADRIGVLVNHVYASPGQASGHDLLIATYAFAVQILCDFSAYTDIARGSARLLGFELMRNFERPYFATSISDFWRRWHISLSTWFRDYLYIPLGGRRVAVWRWQLNLAIVFLVSGLWHGANWTFVAWGALHAGYLLGGIWTQGLRSRLEDRTGLASQPALRHLVRIFITLQLTVFAWIFFRANDLHDAGVVISRMLSWAPAGAGRGLGITTFDARIALIAIACVGLVHFAQERGFSPERALAGQPRPVRWAACYVMLFAIVFFGYTGTNADFIYFQF